MALNTISVKHFLMKRAIWRQTVEEHKGPNDIIADPGDEIICDLCNADVTEDPLYLDGTYLVCPSCRKERD